MTPDKLLTIAAKYIGVTEDPPDSNRVVFNTRYYGREVSGSAYPWCMAFQWYVFQEAGASELFFGGGQTASCGALMRYAKAHGQWITGDYQPGDLIIFDFELDGVTTTDHVGICESAGGGCVTTIDGNTGTTSEANGGAVMRRKRALKYVVGAYRPEYAQESGDEEMTKEQFKSRMDEYIADLSAQEPSAWSNDNGERDWAEGSGLITGDQSGNKKYKKFLTREELVEVLFKFKERVT